MATSKGFGATTNELCTVKKGLKKIIINSVLYACFYDGGEIGSTDVVKTKLRGRCASDLNRKIKITANDNFVAEDYRLAA
jgi:hypothetical protein